MITSRNTSLDLTIRVATQSVFSDFADFLRISKIGQDSYYVHNYF